MQISHASNLPVDFCQNVRCEYKFYIDDTVYSTETFSEKSQNPVFNYDKQHHIECVTQRLLDYLQEEKLTIKIFATQQLTKKSPVKKDASFDSSRLTNSTNNSLLGTSITSSKTSFNPLK